MALFSTSRLQYRTNNSLIIRGHLESHLGNPGLSLGVFVIRNTKARSGKSWLTWVRKLDFQPLRYPNDWAGLVSLNTLGGWWSSNHSRTALAYLITDSTVLGHSGDTIRLSNFLHLRNIFWTESQRWRGRIVTCHSSHHPWHTSLLWKHTLIYDICSSSHQT